MKQENRKTPLVSIIVPVYNAEPFVSRCLDSILEQSYENMEIIIIEDGSDDNSLEICREYEKEYERICLIRHDRNMGLGTTRNTDLAAANGDIVGFLDSDDFIEKNMIETMVHTMEEKHAQVAACAVLKEFEDGSVKTEGPKDSKIYAGADAVQAMYGEDILFASTNKLFKREAIGNKRFPSIISEDLPFVTEVLGNAERVVTVPMPFYHYCIRDGSLSDKILHNGKLAGIEARRMTRGYIYRRFPEALSVFDWRLIWFCCWTLHRVLQYEKIPRDLKWCALRQTSFALAPGYCKCGIAYRVLLRRWLKLLLRPVGMRSTDLD